MSAAMIDTLVASGLTPTQAHAVVRLRADVRCRHAFARSRAGTSSAPASCPRTPRWPSTKPSRRCGASAPATCAKSRK
jgi:hypothetical protein